MSKFLRDLPNFLELNPHDEFPVVMTPNNIACTTLHLRNYFIQYDKNNLIIPSKPGMHSTGTKLPLLFGDELEYNYELIYLILNHLGSLFLLFFFNLVYPRHPKLALRALEQGFQFNYYFFWIAIIQTLNRLTYAFYGLDYEEFRNHQDIKTRSIIEDFNSIFGSILILPLKTDDCLGEIWSFPMSKHEGGNYKEFIISEDNYRYYETRLYEFVLKNNIRLLAPFNDTGKLDVGNSYGEFRALRNPITNYTYLYKSFLPQPQNCEYQDVEIEKMGIKTSFEYKEIFPFHPKTDRYSPLFKETIPKNMLWAYTWTVIKAPTETTWYTNDNSNSLDNENLTIIHLPEELRKAWEEGGKEITAILKGEKEAPLEILSNIKSLETDILIKRIKNNIHYLQYLKALEIDPEKGFPPEHPKFQSEQRYLRMFNELTFFLAYFANMSTNDIYTKDNF